MNMIKAQIEEMYEYLEIYDAHNTLQDILETLSGCGCDCAYSEGVLGKLMNIIGLIRNHSDPSLYDRNIDYYDTRFAKLLDDSQMDNRLKAEYLLGLRKYDDPSADQGNEPAVFIFKGEFSGCRVLTDAEPGNH